MTDAINCPCNGCDETLQVPTVHLPPNPSDTPTDFYCPTHGRVFPTALSSTENAQDGDADE